MGWGSSESGSLRYNRDLHFGASYLDCPLSLPVSLPQGHCTPRPHNPSHAPQVGRISDFNRGRRGCQTSGDRGSSSLCLSWRAGEDSPSSPHSAHSAHRLYCLSTGRSPTSSALEMEIISLIPPRPILAVLSGRHCSERKSLKSRRLPGPPCLPRSHQSRWSPHRTSGVGLN